MTADYCFMNIAINTASLAPNTSAALERAAALGFSHVEVNLLPDEFGYGYKRKPNTRFYRDLRKQLDALGLSVWSVTSVPLTQEQMFFERARKDILINGAGAAGILGAKVYVTRPADLFTSEILFETYLREKASPAVVEGFDETWAQTVNRRMTLALLNQDHWIGAPLTNQADRLAKICDDLAIGCAFDVRRALNRGTLESWLEKIEPRLAVAYLYDTGEDETAAALPPMSDDWQSWLPQLAATRLKCVVLQPGPGHADDALLASHRAAQAIL